MMSDAAMLAPTYNERAAGLVWGEFWRESELDGCTLAFPAEARERIALAWRRAFAVDSLGSVLDVACGKGAVLQHVTQPRRQPLIGVDLAPPACLRDTPFDVRGGIDARFLPFADRAFDTVVSQFGLEYAGLSQAIREAARVSGRALMLLVHARDGAVVAQSNEQLSHISWLDQAGAFARMRAHAQKKGLSSSAVDIALLSRQVVAHANRATNVALLEAVYRVVTRLDGNSVAIASIDALEDGLIGHAARLRELAAAAPGPNEAQAAADILRSSGFAAELRPEGGGTSPLIGRWIIAHRLESRT